MQTLRTQARIAFRTAQHIHRGILTITHHPPAHHQPRLKQERKTETEYKTNFSVFLWLQLPSVPLAHLTRADRAPVVIQHPDLPVVFHLPFVGAVSRAVPPVRTAAVVTSVHVKAHGVVGTAVPPRLTFINVYQQDTEHNKSHWLNPRGQG